eukprot:gnl/MRDRNA2_/MRDRNA2_36396_c0_seq1.p1 gnl/MRDRNA2_/MRDRNA2_36396_c0~~gnl/MRDRNA2_/MRDRNA2_36396_c0_seq1.p1  ORF type:complete len:174 (+),score=48.18 gnl/MRDRNA2_/MRDRNA2_36396_c0_seq1:75-596(+)
MACCMIATILLACVAQVGAEDLLEKAILDKLLDRVLALHDADLDDATLGKAGSVAKPPAMQNSVQALGRRTAGLATIPAFVAVVMPPKPAGAVMQPQFTFEKGKALEGIERRDEAMTPGGGKGGQKIGKDDFTAIPAVNPRGMNPRVLQGSVDWGKGAEMKQPPKKNVGQLPA